MGSAIRFAEEFSSLIRKIIREELQASKEYRTKK
jgi:hypothetical protein